MAQVLLLWPTFFLLDCIDSLVDVVPSARKHAGRRETIRDRKPERSARVDKGTCSYPVLWNAFKRLAAGYSADEKTALFSGAAKKAYRLEV